VRSIEDVGVSLYIIPTAGNVLTVKVPGYESDNLFVMGATRNLYDISPRELQAGRIFTREEELRGQRVCMIGSALGEALFPAGDGIGRTIFLDGAEFTVAGIFAPAKGGFFGENGLDRQIVIPLETARIRYPQSTSFFLTAKARPGQRADAIEEIRGALRKVRHTPAMRGRFHYLDGGFHHRKLRQDHRHDRADLDGDLGARSAGGRHRRDEYHAGQRDRADARDRRAQSHRRAPPRYRAAVFERSGDAHRGRRPDRYRILSSGDAAGERHLSRACVARCLAGPWLRLSAFRWRWALFFGVWPAVTASRLDPVEALAVRVRPGAGAKRRAGMMMTSPRRSRHN
jgi:hypothetical protein